jgi:HD-GYP domain-containing protein (c-di-GMP phosphodiesterase class II)
MKTRIQKPGMEQRATTLATSLVEELVAALVNTRIYQSSHPRVQNSIQAVRGHVRELVDLTAEPTVRIGVADDLLIFRRRPMVGASLAASRLIQTVSGWSAGGIEFDAGGSAVEVNTFFTTVLERPRPGEAFVEANRRLEERGCRSARLLPPYSETGGPRVASTRKSMALPVRCYQSMIDTLQNTTVSICLGGTIEFEPIQEHAEEVLKGLESDDGPLMNLARQDQYDAFTFGHSVRVAVLSLGLARAMTDDRDLIRRVGTAAMLHDVGKALIPFEILHSNAKLSDEERRQMARHPALGAELLLDHRESDPLAIASAFGHHISGPGRGYPRTRHDHQVSVVTEIVRICDVYEALTAARPYKQPMTPTRAYRVMLSMKGQFNRHLLRRFIEVNGIYPNGQMIELDSGEQARVVRQGSGLTVPVVQVLTDPEGNPLEDRDQRVVDLSGDGAGRTIRGLAPEAVDDPGDDPGGDPVVPPQAEGDQGGADAAPESLCGIGEETAAPESASTPAAAAGPKRSRKPKRASSARKKRGKRT